MKMREILHVTVRHRMRREAFPLGLEGTVEAIMAKYRHLSASKLAALGSRERLVDWMTEQVEIHSVDRARHGDVVLDDGGMIAA